MAHTRVSSVWEVKGPYFKSLLLKQHSLSVLGMAMRMREYAVYADYAHIRKYVDADENLIHTIHI